MKKGLVFLLGVVVGIILTIIGTYLLVSLDEDGENNVHNNPVSWYDEPYETITFRNGVDVFQMLQDDYGLSRPKHYLDGYDIYLVHGEKIYDGKHISKNKFNIIGVYTYTDTESRVRNVPVIVPVN